MDIASICRRDVVTVYEDQELVAAAKLMREQHVGYLVVVRKRPRDSALEPVGVLSDRDIVVGVVAKGADPSALRVGDVMTRDPVTIEEHNAIASALKDMRRLGVRRLPIVGRGGELAGVLSLDDVVGALAAQLRDATGSIRKGLAAEPMLRP
jgi:CBS domain-containing protein